MVSDPVHKLRKPKICLITETFHPVIGGGETQARALSKQLTEKNFGVTILTRRSCRSYSKSEQIGEVTVYRLPPAGAQHFKKWGLLLTCIPKLIQLRSQYDLILVCGFRIIGPSVVIIGRLLARPVILKADSLGEMSGQFFQDGLAKIGLTTSSIVFRIFLGLRNWLIRGADAFIAISSAAARELLVNGIAAERIHAIPNSVDMRRFFSVPDSQKNKIRQRFGIAPDRFIVTYTGRLVSYKGLPLLLEVWQTICTAHKNATLFLIGGGGLDIHNCEAELRAYVKRHALDKRVWFTGNVADVSEYLQLSDIFVFPTEREAFGISLIEAMACGLPVISSAVGGTTDIIKHGKNGLLVPPTDFLQLKSALGTLMQNSSLRKQIGQAAYNSVKSKYSVNTVTDQYIEVFKRHTGPAV